MDVLTEAGVERIAKAVAAEVLRQTGGSVLLELVTWRLDGQQGDREFTVRTDGRWITVELRSYHGCWIGNDTSIAHAAQNAFSIMKHDLAKRGEG